jgi:DNA-binding response OmpR family regulator
MRLLIADDDWSLVESLKNNLRAYFVVDTVHSGRDATYQVQVVDYDVVVLDTTLPDISGVDACRTIRDSGVRVPILMSSSEDNINLKISCLDNGADAYITKPINISELCAILRALIRKGQDEHTLRYLESKELSLDLLSRTASWDNQEINLRRKEFDVLEYLLRNKGKIITKSCLLNHIWEWGVDIESNTLEVHIRNIRSKIDRKYGKKIIVTVYGVGYKVCHVIVLFVTCLILIKPLICKCAEYTLSSC